MQVPKGTKKPRNKPLRRKDPKHLAYVAEQDCCCCGGFPVCCHHLLRADPKRGMGRKAGDEYVIPMCDTCHKALHHDGNEPRFLAQYCVDGASLAAKLWSESNG